MTFKQLEALYWVAHLGGFAAAASRLHTTQSAISKRIQELEAVFNTQLFDRGQRSARLTEKGEELFLLSKQLLQQRDAAIEQFSLPEVVQRRLRLGVTELTAMTWLPKLVRAIQERYPKVIIEPDIDLSLDLKNKLLNDELDLIVIPDVFEDPRLLSKQLLRVESNWMCSPLLLNSTKKMGLKDLVKHRLLIQGEKSGTGILYDRWFKSLGLELPSTTRTNNMIALIGMTVAGLGCSYLPRECLSSYVASGALAIMNIKPALPSVPYVALQRREHPSILIDSVITLAEECCDFTRMFST
jgi:DNA-binding transcriptional LysR family regulator